MSARESDLLRLRTIIDCIDDIEETVGAFRIGFEGYVYPEGILDHTCRRSIDMLMLQLCEEAREVTEETRSRAGAIPWRSIAEVRNYFVHSYDSVDAAAVWGFIEEDLPPLRDACAAIVADIESGAYSPRFGSRTRERKSGGADGENKSGREGLASS